jgi:hypothetical protein
MIRYFDTKVFKNILSLHHRIYNQWCKNIISEIYINAKQKEV